MKRYLVAAAACLTLSGCATGVLSAAGVSSSTQATVHLDAGKALALAYSGLDGATLVVETAIKSGYLHGANEQTAGTDLTKAKATLDAAQAAYTASASSDPTSAISAVSDLIAAARALAGAS